MVWLVFLFGIGGFGGRQRLEHDPILSEGKARLKAEEPPVPSLLVVPTPGASSSEDLPPPFLGLVLVILYSSI